MKGYEIAVMLVTLATVLGTANAQYWFQTGARAGSEGAYNNGASITIETLTNQSLSSGSMGFWVGENLPNGAFLQVGYIIENESGNYDSVCTPSGCTGSEYLKAGDAEWFYEYFLNSSSGFLGGIGPDGSAGPSGSFNNYSFYSIGDTWYFFFNGKQIGSANLGTASSGPDTPLAATELANASSANTYIIPTIFSNLEVYKDGAFTPVPKGYSYIGYGAGSEKAIANPYGIREIGSRVNYFEVGSSLPQPQSGTLLWSLGYFLKIASQYANISSSTEYTAYSTVGISAPEVAYISSGKRAIFYGWVGTGLGSYTGILNNVSVRLDSNITETATWQLQYFANISSQYSHATGSGWYANGSTAYYGIESNVSYANAASRYVFIGWSNGNDNMSGKITVDSPLSISAKWQKEFFVNATSSLPLVSVIGSGWYPNGTIVSIYPSETLFNVSGNERYAFSGWSNGIHNSTLQVSVNGPISVTALFSKQFRVVLEALAPSGNAINVSEFYVNNKPVGNFAFLTAGTTYTITGAEYNGAMVNLHKSLNASAPTLIQLTLPLYNVTIMTTDLLGALVPSTAKVSFSNMTTSSFNMGNGILKLHNIPYGYINATITVLGIPYRIKSTGSAVVRVTVFSLLDIALIIVVILAIALSYAVSKRHFAKSGQTGSLPAENR